jgi:hypothetical protein
MPDRKIEGDVSIERESKTFEGHYNIYRGIIRVFSVHGLGTKATQLGNLDPEELAR